MVLLQEKLHIDINIDIDTPKTQNIYSLDEYFALEENSDVRHEFCNGEIEAMTRGTINHNEIIINLIFTLKLALKIYKNYKNYSSNLCLYIPEF